MKKIKIALVQARVPHYRETFFKRLFERQRHSFTLIYSFKHRKITSSIDVKMPGIILDKITVRFLGINFTVQIGLLSTILRHRYEIVILEGSTPSLSNLLLTLIGKLRKFKIIWWSKVASNPTTPKLLSWFNYSIHRVMSTFVDAFIVYGLTSKQILMRLKVDPSRIFVANNTVDVENICANSKKYREEALKLRKMLHLEDSAIALYVGRIDKDKRVDDLLRCFKIIEKYNDNACLLIVGDGPQKEKLKGIASSLALKRVKFISQVPINTANVFFAASDIVVLPGVAGLAVNQAMAHGKPVICADYPGPDNELILDRITGFRIKAGDVEQMAKKVLEVLRDENLAKRMGRKARQKVLKEANLKDTLSTFVNTIDFALSQYAN